MSTNSVFALKVVPRGGGGRLRLRGKVRTPLPIFLPKGSTPSYCLGGFVEQAHEHSLSILTSKMGSVDCLVLREGRPEFWGSLLGLQALGTFLNPQVEREIALHSRLRHRNIVAFHGHFADRDHVYMVLEYCSRQVPGSLFPFPPPPPRICHAHRHSPHLGPSGSLLPAPACICLHLGLSCDVQRPPHPPGSIRAQFLLPPNFVLNHGKLK